MLEDRLAFFFRRYIHRSWLSRKYHPPLAKVDRTPPSRHGMARGGTVGREAEEGRE